MHFKQLEAYVAVVRCQSFSKAASEIYLSQPTVSVHVQRLEEELGTPLIARTPKGIRSTEAGLSFYPYAVELLRLREQAVEAVSHLADGVSGTLDIAASTVPAQYLLPAMLPRLTAAFPDVFYAIHQFDSNEVVRQVQECEREIGICGTIFPKTNCQFTPIWEDSLVLVAPATPEYQQMNAISPEELSRLPFLIRENGSGTRRESEDWLRRCGVDLRSLKVVAQLENTAAILEAVSHGLGVSVVSVHAARSPLANGAVCQLSLPESATRQFYLVTRQRRPLSRAAASFLEFIQQEKRHRES